MDSKQQGFLVKCPMWRTGNLVRKIRIFMWSAGGLALFISKPPGEDAAAGGPLLCDLREHCCFVLLCSVGIR